MVVLSSSRKRARPGPARRTEGPPHEPERFVPVSVEYPSFDGRPMAENDRPLHAMTDALNVLGRYFEDRDDAPGPDE